jgi:hypothetical protein
VTSTILLVPQGLRHLGFPSAAHPLVLIACEARR